MRLNGGHDLHRFFVSAGCIGEGRGTIAGSDVAHISRVLRLGPGSELILFDGAGTEYLARIMDVGKEAITCRILEMRGSPAEPHVDVAIAQGLPKGDKMDVVIQKCTELGASRFIPVRTERSVARHESKLERWRRIATEAAKQSGRAIVPVVEEIIDFDDFLKRLGEFGLCMIPWELELETEIRDILRRTPVPRQAIFLIGPEGGFSRREGEAAMAAGAIPVTLGPRILRTETVGIVVTALAMYEWGGMGKRHT